MENEVMAVKTSQAHKLWEMLRSQLTSIPTSVLVEELITREGVERTEAEPYKPFCVSGEGPAIIMVVTD